MFRNNRNDFPVFDNSHEGAVGLQNHIGPLGFISINIRPLYIKSFFGILVLAFPERRFNLSLKSLQRIRELFYIGAKATYGTYIRFYIYKTTTMTRKTQLKQLWLVSGLILALSTACKHVPSAEITGIPDPTGTGNNTNISGDSTRCSPDTVYFVQQVLPVFQSSCAMIGCHNTTTHKEGLILDSYAGILSTGGINTSSPASSRVYRAMVGGGEEQMPPFPSTPMSSGQTSAILKWIQQGAKDNSCIASGCDTANVAYSTHIKPLIQTNCQGCHSGTVPGGGINLVTYSGVQAVALNGKLLGSIRHLTGYSPMPKGGSTLSDCDIRKVSIWINAGSPNN